MPDIEMGKYSVLVRWLASGIGVIVSLFAFYLSFLSYGVISLMEGVIENKSNGSIAAVMANVYWPLLILFGMSSMVISIYIVKNRELSFLFCAALSLLLLISIIFMGIVVVSVNYELTSIVAAQSW